MGAKARVVLKPKHVLPIWTGHPWVYAQAIQRVEAEGHPGEEVTVEDPKGNFLGRGFLSPNSAIPVRILTRRQGQPLDYEFFRGRLAGALSRRRAIGLPSAETTGFRLVHAEGDGLTGLIVDVLGETLSTQFLTYGMKHRESMVIRALRDVTGASRTVDRTPKIVADQEGMGALYPAADKGTYEPSGEDFSFRESALRYAIPHTIGHKTGFYFDQREVRQRVAELCSGKTVLDLFSYVGAFALAAARAGASRVVAVEQNAAVVEVAKMCAHLNGLGGRVDYKVGDAKGVLAEEAGSGEWDVVILDPPRYAPSRRSVENALVGYQRLAEGGARAVRTGGDLIFACCSSSVDMAALVRAVAIGASRAGRRAVVLDRLFQGPDHPVDAAFGEGLYLKVIRSRIEEL